jgi:hypothetical protein
MESSFGGFSPDDQTEIGLRTGLLGEPLPTQLDQTFGFMIDLADPLAALDGLGLPPSAEEAVARLLVVERLLGGKRASHTISRSVRPTSANAASHSSTSSLSGIRTRRRGRAGSREPAASGSRSRQVTSPANAGKAALKCSSISSLPRK